MSDEALKQSLVFKHSKLHHSTQFSVELTQIYQRIDLDGSNTLTAFDLFKAIKNDAEIGELFGFSTDVRAALDRKTYNKILGQHSIDLDSDRVSCSDFCANLSTAKVIEAKSSVMARILLSCKEIAREYNERWKPEQIQLNMDRLIEKAVELQPVGKRQIGAYAVLRYCSSNPVALEYLDIVVPDLIQSALVVPIRSQTQYSLNRLYLLCAIASLVPELLSRCNVVTRVADSFVMERNAAAYFIQRKWKRFWHLKCIRAQSNQLKDNVRLQQRSAMINALLLNRALVEWVESKGKSKTSIEILSSATELSLQILAYLTHHTTSKFSVPDTKRLVRSGGVLLVLDALVSRNLSIRTSGTHLLLQMARIPGMRYHALHANPLPRLWTLVDEFVEHPSTKRNKAMEIIVWLTRHDDHCDSGVSDTHVRETIKWTTKSDFMVELKKQMAGLSSPVTRLKSFEICNNLTSVPKILKALTEKWIKDRSFFEAVISGLQDKDLTSLALTILTRVIAMDGFYTFELRDWIRVSLNDSNVSSTRSKAVSLYVLLMTTAREFGPTSKEMNWKKENQTSFSAKIRHETYVRMNNLFRCDKTRQIELLTEFNKSQVVTRLLEFCSVELSARNTDMNAYLSDRQNLSFVSLKHAAQCVTFLYLLAVAIDTELISDQMAQYLCRHLVFGAKMLSFQKRKDDYDEIYCIAKQICRLVVLLSKKSSCLRQNLTMELCQEKGFKSLGLFLRLSKHNPHRMKATKEMLMLVESLSHCPTRSKECATMYMDMLPAILQLIPQCIEFSFERVIFDVLDRAAGWQTGVKALTTLGAVEMCQHMAGQLRLADGQNMADSRKVYPVYRAKLLTLPLSFYRFLEKWFDYRTPDTCFMKQES